MASLRILADRSRALGGGLATDDALPMRVRARTTAGVHIHQLD